MKSKIFSWESGVLTGNLRTYHHQSCQAIACTLEFLLQQPMQQQIIAHLLYFTTHGQWFSTITPLLSWTKSILDDSLQLYV